MFKRATASLSEPLEPGEKEVYENMERLTELFNRRVQVNEIELFVPISSKHVSTIFANISALNSRCSMKINGEIIRSIMKNEVSVLFEHNAGFLLYSCHSH